MSNFLAFLAVSSLVIVTPGPDTAMTIRSTLLGGRRAGIATALGVALGQLVWASAAAAGVVALLMTAEPVFLALKYLGAGYLIFLGCQALYRAYRTSRMSTAGAYARTDHLAFAAALRDGLLSNLGNPKMALFFASLLPQFISSGTATLWQPLALGLVFAAMTLAWLALYATMIARAGRLFARTGLRRALKGLAGLALIGMGLKLALAKQ